MKKNLLGASLLTLTGLYILLAAVVLLVCIATGVGALVGIIISIIVIILQFLIAPFFTDLSMKWIYRAKFDYNPPEYLSDFITEITTKENMKKPRLGFIDDGAPNAFTYGHTKNDARVIITRGIIDLLTEDEVKAVVAHELGHAVHYDMLFMTAAQIVPLILYAIYEICRPKNNSSKDSSKTQAISWVAYILYLISNYIVLWLSRTREYYADHYSIEATKNPNSLASALVKVGYGLSISTENKQTSMKSNALGIFDTKASKALVVTSYNDSGEISKENIKDAMKWEQWNIWAKLYELKSTHPLISKRLLFISATSKDYGQEPFITFDCQKTESYVDDFFLELTINFAPWIIFIIGIIITLCLHDINMVCFSITLFLIVLTSFIKFNRRHPSKNYPERKIKDLLGEVKVSGITAIPCSVEGEVIGRGNPGNIFNEDMTMKDSTGIIFLDYNQPLMIVNKIYGLLANQNNIGKTIKVHGWYRRSPVPYIEIKDYEIDGKQKKIFTYGLAKALYVIFFIVSIIFLLAAFL